jgi:hypothetical protein
MYEVSMVTTVKELQEAWGLLYQQYLKYRLIDENYYKLWAFPHYFTKPAGTWVGKENQVITSTVSCVLDKGHLLPLDNYYHNELNQLRLQGARLTEIGLLTAKQESSNSNLLVKLQPYPLAFGLLHGFHDFVIGIHPIHAAYYKKIFGFVQIGEEKQYIHLNKAPVALLYLSLKEPAISTRTQVNLAIQLAQQEDLPLRNEVLCAAFHHKFFSEFKSFYYQYTGQKEMQFSPVC